MHIGFPWQFQGELRWFFNCIFKDCQYHWPSLRTARRHWAIIGWYRDWFASFDANTVSVLRSFNTSSLTFHTPEKIQHVVVMKLFDFNLHWRQNKRFEGCQYKRLRQSGQKPVWRIYLCMNKRNLQQGRREKNIVLSIRIAATLRAILLKGQVTFIPHCKPARKATPKIDISVLVALSTSRPVRSASNCSTKLLFDTPPSTLQKERDNSLNVSLV